ncbi:mesothelin [Tiliqua scincoides]|uniref:mesothelin n=1 Tax=Tiliqua scincoides TaxID=71010 RepID=UPI00346203D5
MANSQMMLPTLSDPLACKEGVDILGDSVCNISSNAIATSGKNLLKQLSQCRSFTPDQVRAIRALLSSGDSPFGPPSEWSSSTLDELRCLFHLLDHSILAQIPRAVLLPWVKVLSQPSREQLATVVRNLRSPRRRRAAECPPGKTVTQEVVSDDLMPLDYSPEELRACLKGPILANNLDILMDYAFTYEQLHVIKDNLDEMFPNGYPSSIAQHLGSLMDIMTPDDFKTWNITSAETLTSLLANEPDDKLAAAIIQQYTDSGGEINTQTLKAIGSRYICLLNEDQLNKIDETAFKEVNNLDLSKCAQTTKNILYPQAKRALSDRHNEFPYYYDMIKPYLGGAPGEDLRALGKDNLNMSIKTFMNLRYDAVMELTIHDVKALLGKNLGELTKEQDNFPIKDWICKQNQSDLDKLGIGLHCGQP